MAGGAARRTPSFEMRSRRSASLAAATSSSAARNASRVALAKTSPDHPTRSIVGALGRIGGGGGGFGQRAVPYASPLHAGTDTSLARCFLPNENTGDAFDGGPDADAASTSSLWAAKATAAPATATAPITVPGSMSTAPSGRIWLRTGLGRVYEDALKAPSKPSLKCNIFQRHPAPGPGYNTRSGARSHKDLPIALGHASTYLVATGFEEALTGRRVVHENAETPDSICVLVQRHPIRSPASTGGQQDRGKSAGPGFPDLDGSGRTGGGRPAGPCRTPG